MHIFFFNLLSKIQSTSTIATPSHPYVLFVTIIERHRCLISDALAPPSRLHHQPPPRLQGCRAYPICSGGCSDVNCQLRHSSSPTADLQTYSHPWLFHLVHLVLSCKHQSTTSATKVIHPDHKQHVITRFSNTMITKSKRQTMHIEN